MRRSAPSAGPALVLGLLVLSACGLQRPTARPYWEAVAPVPESRTEVSVDTDGQRIYVFGGFTPSPSGSVAMGDVPITRTILVYEPDSDSWTAVGELPVETHHGGVARVGERFYFFGGYEGRTMRPRSGTVWIFDPGTSSWTAGAPMPTPRGGIAFAVLDGRIHTFGGTVGDPGALDHAQHTLSGRDASVGTHEAYDPATDRWERLAPMPTARNHSMAGALDGRIYVTGGRIAGRSDGLMGMTRTEIYDPASDSWSEGPPLPTGRSGAGSVVHDNHFYVFGGETSGPTGTYIVDAAERFDPAGNVWERLPAMPSARHGLGAAAVGGRIYVISGGPTPAFSFGTANERLILP